MTQKLIPMAIAYDFDGTLAHGNIQENSFLPKLKIEKQDFWKEAQKLSEENDMDGISSYMYLLLKKAELNGVSLTKEIFKKHGETVKYFAGVEEFFDKVNEYAKSKGVDLSHYIISSGNKEMLEGTSIARYFKSIFACSFYFDDNGIAKWPAIVLNYTSKTQFLFRINKGIENCWDNELINDYMADEERPMPFKSIIYIGDGETDVPAMKIVKRQGGHSISVYQEEKKDIAKKLLKHNRVNFIAEADYSENSKLYKTIQRIIDKRVAEIEMLNQGKIE